MIHHQIFYLQCFHFWPPSPVLKYIFFVMSGGGQCFGNWAQISLTGIQPGWLWNVSFQIFLVVRTLLQIFDLIYQGFPFCGRKFCRVSLEYSLCVRVWDGLTTTLTTVYSVTLWHTLNQTYIQRKMALFGQSSFGGNNTASFGSSSTGKCLVSLRVQVASTVIIQCSSSPLDFVYLYEKLKI